MRRARELGPRPTFHASRDATVKHLAFGNNAEDGWHTLLRLATLVVPIDIISFVIFVTFSPFTCWAILDSCDNISR